MYPNHLNNQVVHLFYQNLEKKKRIENEMVMYMQGGRIQNKLR